jgi:hypothetical protein
MIKRLGLGFGFSLIMGGLLGVVFWFMFGNEIDFVPTLMIFTFMVMPMSLLVFGTFKV